MMKFLLLLTFVSLSVVAAPKKAAKKEVPAPAPAAKVEVKKTVTVVMQTSQGEIEIELNAEKAPNTVANFLSYVDEGFYNGTIFHRVINGFMIQGGGFDEKMNQKKMCRPCQSKL
jgi:hypothetical protein